MKNLFLTLFLLLASPAFAFEGTVPDGTLIGRAVGAGSGLPQQVATSPLLVGTIGANSSPNISVVPVGNPLTTLSSSNVFATSASTTTREYLDNIGFTVNNGAGIVSPTSDKVGLYVGIQGQANAGELWATNYTTYLTPTYNGSSTHHQVEEIDMVTDANAGYVDPRDGPNGVAYPANPVVAPQVLTNGSTSTSSNVLHFASGTLPASLAIGNTVRDLTTPSAISGNVYVTAFTTTTVTMSANAAATVNTSDNIEFKSLYTYGSVFESVGNNNTAAVIIGGSSQWYRGVGCDQTNAAFYSCFFDYSTSQAAMSIYGTHNFGIDMFNASVSVLIDPIRLPSGYGFISNGSWQIASPAADTSLEILSNGTNTPDWVLGTVVSAGTAGRFRVYDNRNAVEALTILQNGLGVKTIGEIYMTKSAFGASAPGANQMKFGVLAGTNAGTCKLIAYAGTSATPVTIVDNVGAGC
jgi:hypothetical protein